VSNLAQKRDYTADFLPFLVENWPVREGKMCRNLPIFSLTRETACTNLSENLCIFGRERWRKTSTWRLVRLAFF
jgi:hypothetical protein